MPRRSLGLIPLPPQTFEHDLSLLGRFQEFSAELLRLALIGISAIGYAVSRLLFQATDARTPPLNCATKALLVSALILLGLSAAAALAHRFFAADSMSWHLQAMRRYERKEGPDTARADAESRARYRRFRLSSRAIACSALALGLGAACLIAAIILALPGAS